MNRVLKVFRSNAEQESLAGPYPVIERFEGFPVIEAMDDAVATIARRFPTEDITGQYSSE